MDELEKLIDAELKALPSPKAPATLMPNVMAAIRAQSAPAWYQRPWFTWPRWWQALSAAAGLGVIAASGWALPIFLAQIVTLIAPILQVMWKTVTHPLILSTLAFMTFLMIVTLSLGGTIARLIWKELQVR